MQLQISKTPVFVLPYIIFTVFFSVPAANSVKGQNIDLYVAAIGDCIRKLRSSFKRSKSDEF